MEKFLSWNDAPVILNANELATLLGISRSNAYTLMHSSEFPSIRVGTRILVPKDKLKEWVDRKANPGL